MFRSPLFARSIFVAKKFFPIVVSLSTLGLVAPSTALAQRHEESRAFAVVVRGPAVFNVIFGNDGRPTGPNPNFKGGCTSPVGLCIEAEIRSVHQDDVVGTMRVTIQEFPIAFGDSFTTKVVRAFEFRNGTVTTPVLNDFHGLTSEPPRFGGTKTFYLGYRDDGALSTGTGDFSHANFLTEMRGRMETVDTAIGAVPVYFDHLFLIRR